MIIQHNTNLIKKLLIKIVNVLRLSSNKNIEKQLIINPVYNKIIQDILLQFNVPNITNNIMQTLMKMGYKISTNDRELIDKLLLYRMSLITVNKLLIEKSGPAIKINDKENIKFEKIYMLDEIKPRSALYMAALDLIPDFYYNTLDDTINKLVKRNEIDHIYILSAIILLLNISALLQILNLSIQNLFSSRISYLNATIVTGLLTKYGLIIQMRQTDILKIINKLNSYTIDSKEFSKVLTDKFIPNLKLVISEYQTISRTFGVV